jgi:hypothetical protein
VHLGRSVSGGAAVEPNQIRIIASGPFPGMSASRIVNGFLSALVDSDGNYEVARSYLAPGVIWHTAAGTTLYDDRSTEQIGARKVEVVVHQVGTIDQRGNYVVAPGPLQAHFTVKRDDGQWRISKLPPGILLSDAYVDQTLQPATVYFLNRAETRLVPEPVLVPPDTPGLATTLIQELIGGPSRSLAPGVVTAVPKGTGLVGNVTIDQFGVAEVGLAGSVQQVSAGQLQRLSAQIDWTLRQVPTVSQVRLLANGAPLDVPGVARVQPIGSWPQFDPDTPPTSLGALVTKANRVIALHTQLPPALAGLSVADPVLNAGGDTVAALRHRSKRTTLLVGPSTGVLRSRLSGPSLSSPAFDPAGDVLVVDGSGARSRVVEVPPVGAPRRVLVPATVREQGISAISVSRDGSRIAMVVGSGARLALFVGVLTVARGGPAVEGAHLVIPGTADVSGVAWAAANEIVTTVRDSLTHRVVFETGVDGYLPHSAGGVGLPKDATQVAAAPGQPMLAIAMGGVWMLTGDRWHRVSAGQYASYAG